MAKKQVASKTKSSKNKKKIESKVTPELETKSISSKPSNKLSKLKTIFIPAIILIILIALLLFFGGEDKRTACEQLQDWVDEHVAPGEKIAIDEEVYAMCPIEHYITDLPGYVPSTEPIDLNVALRGSHTMYVWVGEGEDLNMTITKQDKDWYEGTDELQIIVFGPDRKQIFETIVPDNGIDTNENYGKSILGNPQKEKIFLEKPRKGVYKIQLLQSESKKDFLIANMILTNKQFVLQTPIFCESPTKYFSNIDSNSLISFVIWHKESAQVIKVYFKGETQTIDLNYVNVQTKLQLFKVGLVQIESRKGDLLLDSDQKEYFSLLENSFFSHLLISNFANGDSNFVITANSEFNQSLFKKVGSFVNGKTKFIALESIKS